jgi:hypothetical protein
MLSRSRNCSSGIAFDLMATLNCLSGNPRLGRTYSDWEYSDTPALDTSLGAYPGISRVLAC